jgi:hypothetical protein
MASNTQSSQNLSFPLYLSLVHACVLHWQKGILPVETNNSMVLGPMCLDQCGVLLPCTMSAGMLARNILYFLQ